MEMRRSSPSLELRGWLTQFLCFWILIQGPPLEAAQQRIREKSLVIGHAVEARGAGAGWGWDVGVSFEEGARFLAIPWTAGWTALAPSAKGEAAGAPASSAGQPSLAEKALADLPPGQVIPPPPKPPLADAGAARDAAAARSGGGSAAPANATIAVEPSFNLLSISWQATNPAPAAVLAPIAAAVTKVVAYDACDPADKWKIYDPASPGSSDLAAITPAKGFWLDATGPVTLPEAGPVPASVEIPLCVGWNLIGFPKSSARPVAEALQPIAGKYLRLFGFDPADPADPWEVYDVAVPAWANDLQVLQPGLGYWIYVTEATTLTQSTIGLFLSVDSFNGRNSEPVTLHRYLYAAAEPVYSSDPSGHFTLAQVSTTGSIVLTLANTSFALKRGDNRAALREVGIGLFSVFGPLAAIRLISWARASFSSIQATRSLQVGSDATLEAAVFAENIMGPEVLSGFKIFGIKGIQDGPSGISVGRGLDRRSRSR